MRDQKRCHNMDSHRSGIRSKYDKEMDNAFTLIFHNIKRLQDGHLCDSPPNGNAADRQAEMNPACSTLQVPMQRPRARSDPLSGLAEGGISRQTIEASDTRPKSQSFTAEASPSSQGRKVTFADDYTKKEQHHQGSHFMKRPRSDIQTSIVFNER